MTIHRLLTTMGFLILSLLLMAFQEEPEAAVASNSIPWLVWALLALVAAGLLWLAWSRRDVDAFDIEHHEEHGAEAHGAHVDETHVSATDIDTAAGSGVAVYDAPEAERIDIEADAAPPSSVGVYDEPSTSDSAGVTPLATAASSAGVYDEAQPDTASSTSPTRSATGMGNAAMERPDPMLPPVDEAGPVQDVGVQDMPRVNVAGVDVPTVGMDAAVAGADVATDAVPRIEMSSPAMGTGTPGDSDLPAYEADRDAPETAPITTDEPSVHVDERDMTLSDTHATSDAGAEQIGEDMAFADVDVTDAEGLDRGMEGAERDDLMMAERGMEPANIEIPNAPESAGDESIMMSAEGDRDDDRDATEGEAPGARRPTSTLGMRERPFDFLKVDIPNKLPSAEGSVRDTMEFRFGEDTPGEVIQRPYEGERFERTPMSSDRPEGNAESPPLDVPDLGMPGLDDTGQEEGTTGSDDAVEMGGAGSTFGDTPGLRGGDMVQKMAGSAGGEAQGTSGKPRWFTGSTDEVTAASTTGALASAAGDWDDATLEPPNVAEASDTTLPEIQLPGYDEAEGEAPKWLVTGEDDEADDDLSIVEGIGPKISEILKGSGIRSFRRLASTSAETLRDILDKANVGAIADPSSWAEQAKHAADGAMDKLHELQERLRGGRKEE